MAQEGWSTFCVRVLVDVGRIFIFMFAKESLAGHSLRLPTRDFPTNFSFCLRHADATPHCRMKSLKFSLHQLLCHIQG
jgi:hypothetical protein